MGGPCGLLIIIYNNNAIANGLSSPLSFSVDSASVSVAGRTSSSRSQFKQCGKWGYCLIGDYVTIYLYTGFWVTGKF